MPDDWFDRAWQTLLEHEGRRFVNHPDDPGGATKFGVSLRWLRQQGAEVGDFDDDGDVDPDDIRAMTEQEAQALVRERWWGRFKFEERYLTYRLAEKVFDTAYNMGHRQAIRLLQRACRANDHPTTVDGLFGPNTQKAMDAAVRQYGDFSLLAAFRAEQAAYYRVLVAHDDRREAFIDGWLNRAYY
jgi:lysozyme family protein